MKSLSHIVSGLLIYQASWSGLLRIGLWTMFFLFMANTYGPVVEPVIVERHLSAAQGTSVVPMMVESTYPGWIRQDDLKNKTEKFEIAWVSGSSVHISYNKSESDKKKIHDYLPIRVDKALRAKHNTFAKLFMYVVSGRRVLDTYTIIQDAIDRQVDMIVLAINPMWDFNNKAVFYRPEVFYQAANNGWNRRDWPMQFLMIPPSAHLYNAIGRHLPVMMTPAVYQKKIMKISVKSLGINLKKRNRIVKRNRPKYRQPLQFWNAIRGKDEMDIELQSLNRALKWQAVALRGMNSDKESLPVILFDQMMEKIKESNIKTLIYLAPVSPDLLLNSTTSNSYSKVLDLVKGYKYIYESDRVKFITKFPSEVLKTLKFNDYLHQSEDGILDNYFAQRIKETFDENEY